MNMTSWPILDSNPVSWLGPHGWRTHLHKLWAPRPTRARTHTHTHTHAQTHTRLPSYVNTVLTQFELWYTVSCHSLSGSFTLLELTPTRCMLPSDVNTFCPPLRLWHPTLGHWGSSLHLSHTHTHNGRKKIAALSFLFLSQSIVILVFICRC